MTCYWWVYMAISINVCVKRYRCTPADILIRIAKSSGHSNAAAKELSMAGSTFVWHTLEQPQSVSKVFHLIIFHYKKPPDSWGSPECVVALAVPLYSPLKERKFKRQILCLFTIWIHLNPWLGINLQWICKGPRQYSHLLDYTIPFYFHIGHWGPIYSL